MWNVEGQQMSFLLEETPLPKNKGFINLEHFIMIVIVLLQFPIKEKNIHKYLSFFAKCGSPKISDTVHVNTLTIWEQNQGLINEYF